MILILETSKRNFQFTINFSKINSNLEKLGLVMNKNHGDLSDHHSYLLAVLACSFFNL